MGQDAISDENHAMEVLQKYGQHDIGDILYEPEWEINYSDSGTGEIEVLARSREIDKIYIKKGLGSTSGRVEYCDGTYEIVPEKMYVNKADARAKAKEMVYEEVNKKIHQKEKEIESLKGEIDSLKSAINAQ